MGRREEKLPSRKANEITERPLITTAYTIQFNTIHFINSPNWVFHNYSQDYQVFTKYKVRNRYKRQLNLNATTTVIKNYKNN